ncbi:MAG TPA: site-specific integrase [Caulobacteraceae bacterium]|jgi:integrase
MRQAKLTKRLVDSTEYQDGPDTRVWDTELAGFCLRVYPSGRKSYAVKYRVDGRQRWYTIGAHGSPWSPDEARLKARQILNLAALGEDAVEKKQERKAALTVAQLIERYLAEGPVTKPSKRASSWKADKSNLNNHVGPRIGRKLVRELTRSDCLTLYRDIAAGTIKSDRRTKKRGRAIIRGGAGIAKRTLGTFSAMLSWATEHDLATANPAKGLRLPAQRSLERFLSREEAARLLATLDEMTADESLSEAHADIVRLLLFTGARKGEIVGLRWSEVDIERRRLVLPPERTKAGGKTGVRRIPLSGHAADILSARTRETDHVFPSRRGDRPTTEMQSSWEAIRKRAELPGVRLHDLRHSFASFAVADGESLFLIGKVLGHASMTMTERYAHLADDPLQQLAERNARRIGGAA